MVVKHCDISLKLLYQIHIIVSCIHYKTKLWNLLPRDVKTPYISTKYVPKCKSCLKWPECLIRALFMSCSLSLGLCLKNNAKWHSSCQLAFSGYPDWDFSVLFPQLQGKCQGISRKDGARSALFLISEQCCSIHCFVSIVLFYVLFVCKCVLLQQGFNPIAVDKYIIS
jgi:hypothetical protein